MRTKFGKSLIASGLIAAVGLNLGAASPAFADHRNNNGKYSSRGYQNDGSRNDDNGWNRNDRDDRSSSKRNGQDTSRKYRSGHKQAPAQAAPRNRTVKVIQKPVVVKKTVIVKQPVVIHKKVVHSAPVVRVDHRSNYRHHGGHKRAYYAPPPRVIVVPERRRYNNVWVVRRHGHRYHGYGRYRQDQDAYKWLAFTAISVALINNLTEYQQRSYEDAQIRATAAPIGETIYWNDAGASGSVVATREGTSSQNRYCREFQKTVTIGGNTEQAYGTACMQPNGAWEVLSDNND